MNFICYKKLNSSLSNMILVPSTIELNSFIAHVIRSLDAELVSTGKAFFKDGGLCYEIVTDNHDDSSFMTELAHSALLGERTKFIKFEDHLDRKDKIFVFPGYVEHKEINRLISLFDKLGIQDRFVPCTAGFISVKNDIKCFGRSIGLNIDSEPKGDSALLSEELAL